MRQQIWGEVADYIKLLVMAVSHSGKIIKIGPYLPKLSQKDCIVVLFWLTVQFQFVVYADIHDVSP